MLFQESVSDTHTSLHSLTINGIEIDVMVSEQGEGFGEVTEGGDCLVNGLQGWGGGAVEAAFCEEGHRDEQLTGGASVCVESSKLVTRLNEEVVGNDESVVQLIVYGTVWGDAQYFHHDGIVTV